MLIHPGHLGDVGDLARAVREPGGMDNQIDRRGDLLANRPDGEVDVAHQHERIETGELTIRELEVLRELALGASNREIAERLVIAENTVKNHVRNILAKLNLRNRREATRYAQNQGLVQTSA